jgi:hypothetical protein
MKTSRLGLALVSIYAAFVLVAWSGCGAAGGNSSSHGAGASASTSTGSGTSTSTSSGSANAGGAGSGGAPSTGSGLIIPDGGFGGGAPCSGLGCQIHSCSNGGSTTISGTVYDPAGKNPLYGIVVYVPNAPVSPFTPGASCYSCDQLYTGDPLAAAITDSSGNFTIKNAPDGTSIPLVIQVGKWRRQFTLPSVTMCANTAVTPGMLTLPKNGSEGDLPDIAISTGSADTLECLLVRVGVDASEYEPGTTGTGHIHIFQGEGGPNTSPAAPKSPVSLWDSTADLLKFDILMFSCEGAPTTGVTVTNQGYLLDYANAGGRAFASHYHYAWLTTGPFAQYNLATWQKQSQTLGNIEAHVMTTFPEGQDFHDWLQTVGALTNNLLPIQQAKHDADVTAANTPSQPWLVVEGDAGPTTEAQDFTFDTPFDVDAGSQCGRIAYSDMHVGAADGDYMNGLPKTTPAGCANVDLSPQEKALEFILFDLSSCVTPIGQVQMPPGQTQ